MVGSPASGEDSFGSDTRRRLFDAAAALFRAKGYAGTTTRELAAVIGIQGGSMYHHVARKDELLYGLCVDSLTHITDAVSRAVAAEDEPLARLRVGIITHVETSLADQDKHATMLGELRSLTPTARDEVVELRDAYQKILTDLISAAQVSGGIRTDVPASHLTLALLNLLNWTIFWFQPDGELSSEGVAHLLASLFFDGARQPATGNPAVEQRTDVAQPVSESPDGH